MSPDPRLLAPLLQALRHADLGVVVIADRDGQLERPYFNESCAAMLGYSSDEFAALPVFTTVEPEQVEVLAELRQRIHRDRTAPVFFETSLRHREGHRLPVEVVSHPIDLDQAIAHVIVFRNLLPRHTTQLSLLEADRIALIGALAAGVAHEINNPLTGMLLALRMLRRTLVAELAEPSRTTALRALDDSLSEGERIAANIQALLSLGASRAPQQVDLGVITAAALRLIRPILEDRARVVRELHPVPLILGDEARLGQCILSMLLFAGSGFRGDDPRDNHIVVRVEQLDDSVSVEIHDNGSKLSAKDLVRAFDPFFVSHGRGAGLGVGLGVARSIAVAHGGTIDMTEGSSSGLVTRMVLPLTPSGLSAIARAGAGTATR